MRIRRLFSYCHSCVTNFPILSYVYYASLLVILLLLFSNIMSRSVVQSVIILCDSSSEGRKNRAIQGFVSPIAMFHSMSATVSKSPKLSKLSNVHILRTPTEINLFGKVIIGNFCFTKVGPERVKWSKRIRSMRARLVIYGWNMISPPVKRYSSTTYEQNNLVWGFFRFVSSIQMLECMRALPKSRARWLFTLLKQY